MIITIDGPAGTGKTTVAKRVAEKLGYHFFDSGAMYRAVTYVLMKRHIPLTDLGEISRALEEFVFDIRTDQEGRKRYIVDSEDVTEVIRSPEVTEKVSEVSALASVRAHLVTLQRHFGTEKNTVFEGRDMGTVVFPEAHVKIFLTARPAVRAERRYLELKEKSIAAMSEETVYEQLLERDHFDSTRELAPLKQAEDAHLIDTSDLTIDEVVDRIIAFASRKKSP